MYNYDTLIWRFLCSIGAPSRLWWEGIRPFFGIFDLKFVFLIEFHFRYHLDRSSGTMVWVQKNGVTQSTAQRSNDLALHWVTQVKVKQLTWFRLSHIPVRLCEKLDCAISSYPSWHWGVSQDRYSNLDHSQSAVRTAAKNSLTMVDENFTNQICNH